VVEIIAQNSLVNTNPNSCGFETYKFSTQSELTFDEFCDLVNRKENFFVTDLLNVAKHENKNVIIVTKKITEISKNNNSGTFGVIIHSSATDESGKHFYCGSIDFTDKFKIYRALNINTPISDRMLYFTKHNVNYNDTSEMKNIFDNLNIENDYNESLFNSLHDVDLVKQGFSIVKVGQHNFLNNNDTNVANVQQGLIHSYIPVQFLRIMQYMFIDPQQALNDDEMRKPFNRCPDIQDDLSSELQTLATEQIRQFCEHMHNININLEITNSPTTIQVAKVDNHYIITSSLNIKSLDWMKILTKHNTSFWVQIFKNSKQELIFFTAHKITKNLRVATGKISLGSIVRKLIALCKSQTNGLRLKSLIENCSATLGSPGSGKSTLISEIADKTTLVVAMTSSSVFSLRQKNQKQINYCFC
jgi:hypothetical protein